MADFTAVHSIKRGGRYTRPGEAITLEDPAEIERLLRLGAVLQPPDYERQRAVRAQAAATRKERAP